MTTKFLLQSTDPAAPTVLNGRGPFIPYAWVGIDDIWNAGLGARNLWKKLAGLGIDERPLCLFDVMGWAINVPGNNSYTDWDQITRLWNGDAIDIGGPLAILRRFQQATHAGEQPETAPRPTHIHCMHEGAYMAKYLPKTHGVWTEVVPRLSPKVNPDTQLGSDRLERRAVNGETRATRAVLDKLGWSGSRLSRENIWGQVNVNATDAYGTFCKTMYERDRTEADCTWIRKRGPNAVPHLDAAKSDHLTICQAMKEVGTLRCNVFAGNAGKLDDAYADGLDALASAIKTVWG